MLPWQKKVWCYYWLLVLTVIIIWKGTLEINLSILIGSFVIKTVSMEMVISPVFLFSKPGNSTFATKTAKRKPVDTFILHKETTKRLITTWTNRTNIIHQTNFTILKIWKPLKQASGGHRPYFKETTKWKQKWRWLLISTLFSSKWKLMVWKV